MIEICTYEMLGAIRPFTRRYTAAALPCLRFSDHAQLAEDVGRYSLSSKHLSSSTKWLSTSALERVRAGPRGWPKSFSTTGLVLCLAVHGVLQICVIALPPSSLAERTTVCLFTWMLLKYSPRTSLSLNKKHQDHAIVRGQFLMSV